MDQNGRQTLTIIIYLPNLPAQAGGPKETCAEALDGWESWQDRGPSEKQSKVAKGYYAYRPIWDIKRSTQSLLFRALALDRKRQSLKLPGV